MIYFIDTEFDGHNGELLSIAIVNEDGYSIHIQTDVEPTDPWVIENVMSVMDREEADKSLTCKLNAVGGHIRAFFGSDERPEIIADSPVDIYRFCRAFTTNDDGSWEPTGLSRMSFVVHNVNSYPTLVHNAVQHNAYWDAMALRARLFFLSAEELAKENGGR